MLKTNRRLILLSGPIFIEWLLMMLLSSTDQMMISKYSKTSVIAVGNVNQILNLFAGIVISGLLALNHKAILALISVPDEALVEASSYMFITGGLIFLQGIMLVLSVFFKSNDLTMESRREFISFIHFQRAGY